MLYRTQNMLPLWAPVNPHCRRAVLTTNPCGSFRASFADSPTFIFGGKSDFIAAARQGDSAQSSTPY